MAPNQFRVVLAAGIALVIFLEFFTQAKFGFIFALLLVLVGIYFMNRRAFALTPTQYRIVGFTCLVSSTVIGLIRVATHVKRSASLVLLLFFLGLILAGRAKSKEA